MMKIKDAKRDRSLEAIRTPTMEARREPAPSLPRLGSLEEHERPEVMVTSATATTRRERIRSSSNGDALDFIQGCRRSARVAYGESQLQRKLREHLTKCHAVKQTSRARDFRSEPATYHSFDPH